MPVGLAFLTLKLSQSLTILKHPNIINELLFVADGTDKINKILTIKNINIYQKNNIRNL